MADGGPTATRGTLAWPPPARREARGACGVSRPIARFVVALGAQRLPHPVRLQPRQRGTDEVARRAPFAVSVLLGAGVEPS